MRGSVSAARVLAKLFFSPALLVFFSFATLEAGCTGGAIFVLTRIPRGMAQGWGATALLVFVALTACRFICRGLAEMALARTQGIAIGRLMFTATARHTARPDLRGETQARHRFVGGLSSAGIDIATGLMHFLDRACRVSLTTAFMLVVYADLLGAYALLANLAGLAAAIVAGMAMTSRQRNASARFETRRMQLAALPAAGWDTITIANTANLRRWDAALSRACRNFMRAQRSLSWTTVSSQWLIVLMSHIPSLLALWFILDRTTGGSATALIVALPGFMVLLGSQAELASVCASAGVLSAQVKVLERLVAKPRAVDLRQRVDFARVRFHDVEGVFHAEDAMDLLAKLPPSGAVCMTGDNGSGKSSLFLYLKVIWGSRAFYLPANHSLFAHKTLDMSTGESVVDQVSAALADAGVRVLLMDEWRANLDRANCREIADMLLAAAENGRLVIESMPTRP